MQRTRRIRSRGTAAVSNLQELVDAAVAAQHAADAAVLASKDALEALGAAMKKAKTEEVRSGRWKGIITRSAGRETNVVDPVAFRKLVKEDKDFYSAITVSITNARKVLPTKTLETITKTTPGKPGPEVVKLVEVK